ncbi:MAG: DUF484 family protein [Alphaproteobacteria bacterium]|nr:DUF484 family protein [Alphaproteobacteria bacterium]
METMTKSNDIPAEDTKKLVEDYLRSHPTFLMDNPEMLEVLLPPAQNHGRGVVDFQFFAIDNLRRGMGKMKDKFNHLVTSARDNMSTQQQVQRAVLSIIRAKNLEQLLEVLTTDLLTLFDVDVVRLAIESNAAGLYDTYYSEHNYSGICFVPINTAQAALMNEKVRLIADTHNEPPIGFEMIFADCSNLVRSCALLRLDLERVGKPAILSFGVRDSGHFNPSQGSELLGFLAAVMAVSLDRCLNDAELPV